MSYAIQSDIEDIFGTSNVAAWTLFEPGTPSGPADPTRIATALAYAESEIDAFFIGSPYVVPLVCNICKSTVTYWAAAIAGIWLYGNRVTASYIDYAGNRYIAMRAAVYSDMYLYKSGTKRLDAPFRFPHTTAPAPSSS